MDAVCSMSDGNPGAIHVMVRLVKESPTICPSWGFAGMLPLIQLDAAGLYGSSIWVLYKDICGSDTARTWALLCAEQLGLVCNGKTLKWIVEHPITGEDIDYLSTVIDAVPTAIKDFALPQAELVAKTARDVGEVKK